MLVALQYDDIAIIISVYHKLCIELLTCTSTVLKRPGGCSLRTMRHLLPVGTVQTQYKWLSKTCNIILFHSSNCISKTSCCGEAKVQFTVTWQRLCREIILCVPFSSNTLCHTGVGTHFVQYLKYCTVNMMWWIYLYYKGAHSKLVVHLSPSRLVHLQEFIQSGPQIASINLSVSTCHWLQNSIMYEYVLVLLVVIMRKKIPGFYEFVLSITSRLILGFFDLQM